MKIKKRYGKYGGYLPHCIVRDIKRLIKKEEVNNPEYYIQVDDKFFIKNEGIIIDSYKYIGFAVFGILLLYFIVALLKNKDISFFFSFFGGLFIYYLLLYSSQKRINIR